MRKTIYLALVFQLLYLGSERNLCAFEERRSIDREGLVIGSFNLLRLGHHKTKKFSRVAKIMNSHNFQIVAVQEVMNRSGAAELLKELQKLNSNWSLILSKHANGESTYKEFFAFYYLKNVIDPVQKKNRYCTSSSLGVASNGHSCFARDYQRNGPDFERDPFIGHFQKEGREISLVSVHLFYGDKTKKNIEKRKKEVRALKRVMASLKRKTPSANIVALGDFNLAIKNHLRPRLKAFIPEAIFLTRPLAHGLIHQPTTIGHSTYDHFIVLDSNHLRAEASSVIIDYNFQSIDEKNTYKKEVSDHFPIRLVLYKP